MPSTETDNSDKAFHAWSDAVAADDVHTIPDYIPTEDSYENEIDQKTGFSDGKALRRELKRLVYTRKRNFCVYYIDANGLKKVNDDTGSHEAGDIYIGRLAHKLNTEFAKKDKKFRPNGEEGDEFVVIIEDIDSESIMEEIGKRIQDSFSHTQRNGDFTQSVCIGGVFIGSDATDQDVKKSVLGADKAMYDAKTESTRLQHEQKLSGKPTVFVPYNEIKYGPIGMLDT
jgi:diguanylate cyclase (GGDEF)-like protein